MTDVGGIEGQAYTTLSPRAWCLQPLAVPVRLARPPAGPDEEKVGVDGGDALGRLPVPAFGLTAGLPSTVEDGPGLGDDAIRVGADHPVGALRHRDRALRVLPEGQAGDSERGGLLLQPAGVGEAELGLAGEAQEVEITQRLDGPELGHGLQAVPRSLQVLPGAGVDREDHRQPLLDPIQRAQEPGEGGRVIDVGGAVEGAHRVTARLQAQLLDQGPLPGRGDGGEERINSSRCPPGRSAPGERPP